MRAKSILAASAAVLTLSAAAFALAQPAPEDGPGPPPAEMRQHMQERHDRLMADVRTILRLRPDQEGAFQAFAKAIMPQPVTFKLERPKEGLTTPQMMAEQDRMQAERRAEREHHRAAVVAFYGVLSADQKPVFDALMRLHHMHGGGGPMMMGGEGMGPMGPGRHEVRIIRQGPGGQ